MLLKISLGLAILVGLVTLYVTNFQVGGKITELKGNLEQTTQQLTSEQENNRKLSADNRTLKNNLETTVKNLNDVQAKAENDLLRLTAEHRKWYEQLKELRQWYSQDTRNVRDAFCNLEESPG